MKYDLDSKVVCVVGLGFVGLPLAQAFARNIKVIGYDIKSERIKSLARENKNKNITYTDSPAEISKADFVIISVPTPLTDTKEPDLTDIVNASRTIGKHLKKGSIVIPESSYYPGVTEEIIKPVLEESGMKCGPDFKLGYSPERVNPGDVKHDVGMYTKVVSGMDAETTDIIAQLYSRITPVFIARNIKTAEASKLIENIQRDLNIALMNELSLMFEKMGLNTKDVLDAAATKWNFVRYSPGLVGGHCIPINPYYLMHKAKMMGYHAQVILAGRAINDSMAKHVAEMTIKGINEVGKVIKGSNVLIMGLTYKENVADVRETPVRDVIKELKEFRINVYGLDPVVNGIIEQAYGIKAVDSLKGPMKYDAVILTVVHDLFKDITLNMLSGAMNSYPVLIDVRGHYNMDEAGEKGFYYRTL